MIKQTSGLETKIGAENQERLLALSAMSMFAVRLYLCTLNVNIYTHTYIRTHICPYIRTYLKVMSAAAGGGLWLSQQGDD